MSRHANGEGTVTRRKDGRYEAAFTVATVSGKKKRIRLYARTRAEVYAKLVEAKAKAQQGIRVADKTWKLGDYLDYWLAEVVRPTRRATTYARYEIAVRLYLKPELGTVTLGNLSASQVQAFINQKLASGLSVRNAQIIREVLRAALSRAMREELIVRNVASLVELPKWEGKEITPWTVEEAQRFLLAATSDPLHVAFLLAVLYGLRRGEVLGLRWCDVDLDASVLHVRQQVQRIEGQLQQLPLKTRASRRDLPLINGLRTALLKQRQVTGDGPSGLVFATKTGQPIEPRNYRRSFERICAKADVRPIRIHDMRHTAATLLKKVGASARDAQLILGHSTVTITQNIYQHDDMESRLDALGQVERFFLRSVDRERCRQTLPSDLSFDVKIAALLSGRGDRTRTCDTRFWRSLRTGALARATEVNRELVVSRKQRLVGCVAVSVAVKPELFEPPNAA